MSGWDNYFWSVDRNWSQGRPGWTYDGEVCWVVPPLYPTPDGGIGLQVYENANWDHAIGRCRRFLTQLAPDTVIENQGFELICRVAWTWELPGEGRVPIYRFYRFGYHFWTLDSILNDPDLRRDGPVVYVYPPFDPKPHEWGTKLYRFKHPYAENCAACGGRGSKMCTKCGGHGTEGFWEKCILCGGHGCGNCSTPVAGETINPGYKWRPTGTCKKCEGDRRFDCERCWGSGGLGD